MSEIGAESGPEVGVGEKFISNTRHNCGAFNGGRVQSVYKEKIIY